MAPFEFVIYTLSIIGIVAIVLAAILRNNRSLINITFIGFTVSVMLYITSSFVSEFRTFDLNTALFYTRLALLFANFVPMTFFFFAMAVTGRIRALKIWNIVLAILLPVLISLVAFDARAITSVKYDTLGTSIDKTGFLLYLTLFYYMLYFTYSMVILYKNSRQQTGSERVGMQLIMIGVGTAVSANLITQIIFPSIGIGVYGDLVGAPSLLMMVGFMAYAILRHNFLDVRNVAARSVAFLLWVTSIVLVYSLAAFQFGRVFFNQSASSTPERIFYLGVAIALALTFQPVLNFYAKISDKLFYNERYEPGDLINEISKIMASERELKDLIDHVQEALNDSLRAKQISTIVLEGERLFYASSNLKAEQLNILLAQFKKLGNDILVTDNLELNERREFLHNNQVAVFVPLSTNRGVVGYMLLGGKASGYIYSKADLQVLSTLSKEFAVAIENALAYSQISHFNDLLKGKIESATHDLTVANNQLKQLDKAKDEFISMTSHQLRTPLSVISGYIQLILYNANHNIPQDIRDSLKKALNNTDSMSDLVNGLLNVSRMDAGRFHLEKSKVDVTRLVDKAVEQMQLHADQKGVKLEYTKPATLLPQVLVDQDKTQQAINNLIDNAIYYTPKGAVQISLTQKGSELTFMVKDNGIGVPAAQQAKLFTRFFRATNAQTTRPDGTGLGLYIVRRIVEDQGGKMLFSSVEGKGSNFGFTMPIAAADAPVPAA